MSKLPSGIRQHFRRDVGHSVHVTESQILTDIVGNLFNVSLKQTRIECFLWFQQNAADPQKPQDGFMQLL